VKERIEGVALENAFLNGKIAALTVSLRFVYSLSIAFLTRHAQSELSRFAGRRIGGQFSRADSPTTTFSFDAKRREYEW
jgi:hypothetical protein